MINEVIELLRGTYKSMADDDELWQCLAVITRKYMDALIKEGFSREEALGIVAKMPNVMQLNK